MLTLAAADTLAGVASAASKVTCTCFGMELNAGVEAYKVLDQRQLAAAAATIYTAPASTTTFVKAIAVVNTDTDARTFQLFRGGTTAAYAITPVWTLAAGASATYEDGLGWQFYTATGLLITGYSVANAAIWTAAGDLAVGSGAATAAVLAKGVAGAVLAMGNSAVIWNAGTSFPASKATGDRYWRTDLGMEFYWDGAHWLSTELFTVPMPMVAPQPMSSSSIAGLVTLPLLPGINDILVLYFNFRSIVTTTNDATNFWGIYLRDSSNALHSTPNTGVESPNTSYIHTLTLTPFLYGTTHYLFTEAYKYAAPGSITAYCSISYRLVGA